MALHLLFWPHAGAEEPIERPNAASIRKLKAKVQMAEVITFLRWTINTRALTISLPTEKAWAWSKSINSLIKSTAKIQHSTLATLTGRLNHVGNIIPQACHFMNRIRIEEARADKFRSVRLTRETKLDLKLWLRFIKYAAEGISLWCLSGRIHTKRTKHNHLCLHGFNQEWRIQQTVQYRTRHNCAKGCRQCGIDHRC